MIDKLYIYLMFVSAKISNKFPSLEFLEAFFRDISS